MTYQHLDWDSTFFGFRVGLIKVTERADESNIERALKELCAKVTYVFVPIRLAAHFHSGLTKLNGKCYDRKRTYFKKTLALLPEDADSAIIETTLKTPELIKLAYASGHLSRFNQDPLFRPHFKKLYYEWTTQSLCSRSGCVFGFYQNENIAGFVTTSVSDQCGNIGLLAVHSSYRGLGIGSRLLKQCDRFYSKQNAFNCRVTTQAINHAACKLYEKNGYTLENEVDVWHIWQKDLSE